MTLREMRAQYRHLFHPTQDWFEGEAFMDRQVEEQRMGLVVRAHCGIRPASRVAGPFTMFRAADVAAVFLHALLMRDLFGEVGSPHGLLDRYIWTSDTDGQGQQVYIGYNGRGIEIHRHLHLTDRWGVLA